MVKVLLTASEKKVLWFLLVLALLGGLTLWLNRG
jgi:hypothetical protein